MKIFLIVFVMFILSVIASCGNINDKDTGGPKDKSTMTEQLQASQAYSSNEIALAKTVCDNLQAKKINYNKKENANLEFHYQEECTSCEDLKTTAPKEVVIKDDVTDTSDDFKQFCSDLRTYLASVPAVTSRGTSTAAAAAAAATNTFKNTISNGIEKFQYNFATEVVRTHKSAGKVTVIPVTIIRAVEGSGSVGENGEIIYDVLDTKSIEVISSKDLKWRGIIYSLEKKNKCPAKSKRTNEYIVEKLDDIK
ncbi:MAG: hypothetical protein HQK49_21910 [Oligoflexia bacterium]|nr:hypothetical protein [Oligoflexia bacterium]